MLTDASEYGPGGAEACRDVLNASRARDGRPPLPAARDRRMGSGSVYAYVNHGRWVVDCPCGSAQLASREDRRFWCVDCANEWAGGRFVAVTWPADAEAIEGLLLLRPFPKTRNWNPSEDAMLLLAENAAHGIGA